MVELAERGERAGAVLIDLLFILIILIVIWLAVFGATAAREGGGFGWILAFVLLVSFLVRSFYFVVFELRWQGRTPGKRLLGLRVIDRSGGPLRAQSVFARNLMREVELFLPIQLLLAGPGATGVDALIQLLMLVWVGVFVLMPFFNRDRLRAGDLVGGTWVVSAPEAKLLPDLAGDNNRAVPAAGVTPASVEFTEEQLAVYGIYELQTLEDVLRRDDANAAAAWSEVASRIQQKIAWQPSPGFGPEDSKRFLEAFYAALRGHLERRMLFGVRRRDKHDRPENDTTSGQAKNDTA